MFRHAPIAPSEARFIIDMITEAGLDRPAMRQDDFNGADVIQRLKRVVETTDRERQVIEMARDEYHRDGEVEIDHDATLSEGDDNGSYVLAWVWVSFDGTPLDKSLADEDGD